MYIFTSRCRVPGLVAVLATVVALALVAAPADADQPPAFTAGPVIEGKASVGAELRVVASWTGVPAPATLYEWDRCDTSGLFCDVLVGACGATRIVAGTDVGARFRVQVHLFNAAGGAAARTPLTDMVLNDPASVPGPPATATSPVTSCAPNIPPAAPPPPTPPADPPPPASPAAAPVSSAPETATASVRAAYMRPFPTVRIRGYSVPGGARITFVSVRGKPTARIRGTCVGAGCPRPGPPIRHPPARLRALEGFLRAGTVLQIRVTAGAAIGKYTSFRILAHHPPRRVDRCLLPGRWAPVRCPA